VLIVFYLSFLIALAISAAICAVVGVVSRNLLQVFLMSTMLQVLNFAALYQRGFIEKFEVFPEGILFLIAVFITHLICSQFHFHFKSSAGAGGTLERSDVPAQELSVNQGGRAGPAKS